MVVKTALGLTIAATLGLAGNYGLSKIPKETCHISKPFEEKLYEIMDKGEFIKGFYILKEKDGSVYGLNLPQQGNNLCDSFMHYYSPNRLWEVTFNVGNEHGIVKEKGIFFSDNFRPVFERTREVKNSDISALEKKIKSQYN